MKIGNNFSIETLAIHSGEAESTKPIGSVADITMATTFLLDKHASISAENIDDNTPFVYTRWANPTIKILENKIAVLEGAESAVAVSTGMGTVSSVFLSLLKSGDRILVSDVCYPGVREFCSNELSNFKIKAEAINMSDLGAVKEALSISAKLIYLETPSNPILRLTDLKAVSKMAKNKGVICVVDSTFATPMATRPLDLGVDLVMHSLSKYIGGHGDAMGGIIAGDKKYIDKIRYKAVIHIGNVISPFNAWLINRGIGTLPIRMKSHSENALKVARLLEKDPNIKQVNYPGLKSHPQHELAKKQMKLFSGVMSFQVKNDASKIAERMRKKLKIVHYAVSLGHHKTLIFYLPTDDLHQAAYKLAPDNLLDYKKYAGEGVFRLSVGLEDPNDIYEDLRKIINS